MRRWVVAALLAATSAAVVGALGVPADAHAELIDADPLPGSTINSLERVELRFAGDIIEDERTTITLELRRDPEVFVELGPPEVVVTAALVFVEDDPQPWGRLVVRGADDDARITVSGVAGQFELTPESSADGRSLDISSLEPDAVSIIRIAQPGIDPEAIEVDLSDADGNLVPLSPVLPASSNLAADVIGELPEAGDYILRFNTVAADEGLVQPNGYLFSYDPAFVDPDAATGSGGSGSTGLIIVVAAIVVAGGGVAVLARRRAAVADG